MTGVKRYYSSVSPNWLFVLLILSHDQRAAFRKYCLHAITPPAFLLSEGLITVVPPGHSCAEFITAPFFYALFFGPTSLSTPFFECPPSPISFHPGQFLMMSMSFLRSVYDEFLSPFPFLFLSPPTFLQGAPASSPFYDRLLRSISYFPGIWCPQRLFLGPPKNNRVLGGLCGVSLFRFSEALPPLAFFSPLFKKSGSFFFTNKANKI